MKPETLRAIDLTEKSAARTRRIYMMMQIASIVVFMALWHETPFAWGGKRLRLAQAIVWQLECGDSLHPRSRGVSSPPSAVSPKEYENCQASKPPFSDRELKYARRYIAETDISSAYAVKRLELITATQLNINVIAVPMLGFTIDINDLSLLGGITFMSLLLWLGVSLRQDEKNIRFLLGLDDELPDIIRLLSMMHFLAVPMPEHGKKGHFWSTLPVLLYWAPVATQLLVLLNDSWTLPKGVRINPGLAVSQLIAGLGLLFVIMVITRWCQIHTFKMRQHWFAAITDKKAEAAVGSEFLTRSTLDSLQTTR